MDEFRLADCYNRIDLIGRENCIKFIEDLTLICQVRILPGNCTEFVTTFRWLLNCDGREKESVRLYARRIPPYPLKMMDALRSAWFVANVKTKPVAELVMAEVFFEAMKEIVTTIQPGWIHKN
jgi:hypothetical protein